MAMVVLSCHVGEVMAIDIVISYIVIMIIIGFLLFLVDCY